MSRARAVCTAVFALVLVAGVSPAGAADKSDSVPPTHVYGSASKNPLTPVDPDDPNKGLSGPHEGPAGVPANDLCANAQVVAVPSDTAGTTVDSTFDGVGTCGTSNTAPGVWYTFTPTDSGPHSVSTCNQADYDTKISVFAGTCGGLSCVAGLDDTTGCTGFTTRLAFPATAGVPVLVLVHGFDTAVGDFTLSVRGPAANDLCTDAIPLAVPSTVSGDTTGGTIDAGFPLCGTNFGSAPTAPGIWYEVVGNGNVLQASLCNQADYDSQITVYCQDCATPFCITGNDDATGCGLDSELTWESELNATYRILVHGFSTEAGPFDLTVTDTGVASIDPEGCFGPRGACCDPTTGGCKQTDEFLCNLAGGSFGEGIPCAIPTGGVTSITSSPGVAIPDNDTIGVSDTVNVPESFPVATVSVDVGITHTWIGDLRIRLQNNQTGQIINMWNRRCGSTADIDTTFIDGGPDTLCAVVSAGGGQVDPLNAGLGPAFSTLNGVSATGDWTLIVDDNFPADVGTLNTWTLNLVEGQSACYAYPPVQEIPTMDRKGLVALALLLAGAAAFLIGRRRG